MSINNTSTHSKVDESPIVAFHLERYLGLWYEVARYDNWFERSMEDVTAEYTLLPSGKIRVENRGFRDGNVSVAIGRAKITEITGRLKVAFILNFYSPYNVLYLTDDYSCALVSSGHKYLWILSRKTELSQVHRQKILDEANRRGFDTEKLLWQG